MKVQSTFYPDFIFKAVDILLISQKYYYNQKLPKWLIFDAFTLLICGENVANYALLRCKTFCLKIWLCKFFDKYHVCLVPPVNVESPKISSVNLRSRSQPCDFRLCKFTMFAHTCNDRKTCHTTMQCLLMPIYFGVFVHRLQIWSLGVEILPISFAQASQFPENGESNS